MALQAPDLTLQGARACISKTRSDPCSGAHRQCAGGPSRPHHLQSRFKILVVQWHQPAKHGPYGTRGAIGRSSKDESIYSHEAPARMKSLPCFIVSSALLTACISASSPYQELMPVTSSAEAVRMHSRLCCSAYLGSFLMLEAESQASKVAHRPPRAINRPQSNPVSEHTTLT